MLHEGSINVLKEASEKIKQIEIPFKAEKIYQEQFEELIDSIDHIKYLVVQAMLFEKHCK